MRFNNHSWNDTVVGAAWTFSNAADSATSIALTGATNKFHQPGWVHVSLAVTGNHTGTTTLTNNEALYIADSTAINAANYVHGFDPGTGMDQWPMFNYYSNDSKWQLFSFGVPANNYLMYSNYDSRPFPQNKTGWASRDYDDIYTPGFDFTSTAGNYRLNLRTSGATQIFSPYYMRDSLEITYSTDYSRTLAGIKSID